VDCNPNRIWPYFVLILYINIPNLNWIDAVFQQLLSGHQISDGRTNGRTHARTGFTLNAPPGLHHSCVVPCVSLCTGHFVMVPLNMTFMYIVSALLTPFFVWTSLQFIFIIAMPGHFLFIISSLIKKNIYKISSLN